MRASGRRRRGRGRASFLKKCRKLDIRTSLHPMSAIASTSSMPTMALSYIDHFAHRRVSLTVGAGGNAVSPLLQRAQIKRPLELMRAALYFFAQQSAGYKRHRQEPLPPLGFMFAEHSPLAPLRVMSGCVATACHRLATAPGGMRGMERRTGRWAGWVMERVTRGRVVRVQVRLAAAAQLLLA